MWSIIFEFFGRNKALPRQQLWKRKTNYTLKGKEKTSICFFLQGSWIVTVALLPCQVNVWLPPNPLLSRSTTVNSYLLVQAPRIKEDRQHNVILIPQSYPLNKTSKNIPGFLLCTTGCWYGALSRGFCQGSTGKNRQCSVCFIPSKLMSACWMCSVAADRRCHKAVTALGAMSDSAQVQMVDMSDRCWNAQLLCLGEVIIMRKILSIVIHCRKIFIWSENRTLVLLS